MNPKNPDLIWSNDLLGVFITQIHDPFSDFIKETQNPYNHKIMTLTRVASKLAKASNKQTEQLS